MLHEPAVQSGKDPAASFKMRVGVYMFVIYALFYAGFVALNVFKPVQMETQVLLGMNLAVTYGFGLIVFALILALIYTVLCGQKEAALSSGTTGGGDE